ncbi:hybrid sensor histidine kinase/response regulator [Caulobacter hibisci]|uniref:histidine kinase n=1 Tax=Caulobacter hibisci TaxID=2035993 RepID=A0ABS0T284_9CAUL|nr:PAS domain-containing sensor histidine kinase [Caulobacter hibisci]MBI1685929.1 PAS domain S-box protein [Caulobacter hibisci]
MGQFLSRTAIRFASSVDRPILRFCLAAAAVGVAVPARYLAAAVTDYPTNFPTFFVAVMVAALVGGLWTGLLSVVAAGLIVRIVWMDALSATETAQLATFCACGAVIVLVVAALRLAVRSGLAAEERFRIAQEASLDAFVILEPIRRGGEVADFRWTYANPAAQAMRPKGVSTLVGRRVRDVFRDATGPQMIDRLKRLLDEGGPDDLEVMRVIDGEERWVRSSGVRISEGLAITFRDVSRERRAQAALRTSEEQFRGVANAAPVMIWISDVRGDCTWFNDAWLKFTGRSLEEEHGRGWADGVHPDDLEPAEAEVRVATQARRPFRAAFRLRRADGAWRWISSAGAPRHDAYGQFQGYIGSCFDNTEVIETTLELEARVIERTAALEASIAERAKTEAALAQSQRLETVGRLTGGVAHDFNNLLTVMIGGLDMILKRPDEVARVKRLGEAALAAGQRGERLTRQLLAFSRSQELKLEVVDVAGLILQVEPLVRRAAGDAKTLVVEADPKAGSSRVDAAQLEAALLNLVVNAVDATPDAGTITVSVRAERLADGQAGEAPAGDYVCVAVTDTGHGMSPEVLARVFEPFFTTKEVGKGTGLGLAQVYGFVRQCGGAVTIDSQEGRGTTVSLHLPAAEPDAAGAVTPQAAPAADLSGLRVLLVEDDASVRAITEGALLEMGCAVVVAEHGPAALALLEVETEPFDVLLSDLVMPGGVSGVELARAVVQRAPDTAVLLTTGYAGDRLAAALEDLPWPVLRKPFRIEQLARALAESVRA